MENKQAGVKKQYNGDPKFEFVPKFYILDKCELTVLAAKKQDRYEVKGMFARFDKKTKEWEIWPACFNNQLPWEFPDRFVITKDEQEAWLFAIIMSTAKPLPGDWCLEKYPRARDFPVY